MIRRAAAKAEPKISDKQKVTFEYYAPEARNVIVTGTFNGWKTGERTLDRDKSGRWTASVELPPGRYEYRYVVDGKWTNDQRPVERSPNPYGSFNSVVVVK